MPVYYPYQREVYEAAAKINEGTISHHSDLLGRKNCEPLLVCMDSLLRYAKAYEKRYETKLVEDYFLGRHWLSSIKHLRVLLNGNGAVAMEQGISTDSKDNGVIEEVFWKAMEVAGFTEEDL